MFATPRPEAIDSRLVFRIYASCALPFGIVTYMWPFILPIRDSPASVVRLRVLGAVITALGCCASAFAAIDDPLGRRRGLMGFAHAHLMLGAMLAIQAWAQYSPRVAPSPLVASAAVITGLVLMYLGITGPGAIPWPRLPHPESDLAATGRVGLHLRNRPAFMSRLRSEYEMQIRNAARQEERARLARDLHDAVKQQLFVIQTAGATAQARFDTDAAGARAAVEQIRSAAREAMTEMEAMLDQLQSAPISNEGLIAFLRKQCEALGFRTGATVSFTAGPLPDERALDPGARQAIARVAQESLSNVARHARARNVTVSLGPAEGWTVLTIKDDGAGFTPGSPPRPAGMGMENLAMRAAEVGGSLDVTSTPGAGTVVRFAVPRGDVPSPRIYVVRVFVWSAILLSGAAVLATHNYTARLFAIPVMIIAAIAIARYSVAAYNVERRRG
ncbi:MAG TPA: sensor histidine kinase [Vicinamibacterales bacterium]|nr:sensor histidine kinase [Vicinamibacterales bacterium]